MPYYVEIAYVYLSNIADFHENWIFTVKYKSFR